METKICKECGNEYPIESFKLTRWGVRADICNQCVAIKRADSKHNKRNPVGGGVKQLPFPTPTSTASSHARS